MKLFVGSLIGSAMLVILAFMGLAAANPALAVGAYCGFSAMGFPLLWVATYRFFSRSVELKFRRD